MLGDIGRIFGNVPFELHVSIYLTSIQAKPSGAYGVSIKVRFLDR